MLVVAIIVMLAIIGGMYIFWWEKKDRGSLLKTAGLIVFVIAVIGIYGLTGSPYSKGKPFQQRDIHAEKIQHLNRQLLEQPADVEIWLALAVLHQQRGNTEKALDAFRGAALLEPDNEKIQQEIDNILK